MIKKTVSVLSLIVVAAILAGCATLDSMYDKQVVTQTNHIPFIVLTTNIVDLVVRTTNEVDQIVLATNIVEDVKVVTQYKTEVLFLTNLVVMPGTEAGIAATGAIPIPGAPLAAAAMSLLYAGYASWRNRQTNTRYKQVGGTLISSIDQIQTLIGALPATGVFNPTTVNSEITRILKASQQSTGTRGEVKKLMDETPSPI